VGVHFAIIIVASLSLFLSWRQVYFVSREYLYFKRKVAGSQNDSAMEAGEMNNSRFRGHTEWQKNWEDLGFLDKLKFFDFWFVVIVAGNFFQIFGALVALL
jgi:hypothetical protein